MVHLSLEMIDFIAEVHWQDDVCTEKWIITDRKASILFWPLTSLLMMLSDIKWHHWDVEPEEYILRLLPSEKKNRVAASTEIQAVWATSYRGAVIDKCFGSRNILSVSNSNVFCGTGGAFELVSCPHYLGEIVIYLGLCLQLDVSRALCWLPLAWVVSRLPLSIVNVVTVVSLLMIRNM